MKSIIKFLLKYIPRPFLIKLSLIFRKPVAFFYRGKKQECTICEGHFRKFLPYGYASHTSSNRLCPKCLSLERHRLLWKYLHTETNFFTAKLDVLHIAPEQPFLKAFRQQHQEKYVTADLESPIADVKADVRDMKKVFDNEKFDYVICNHVMEHIDREQEALKEILRILKPGGHAILQVPIDSSLEQTFEDSSVVSPKERERLFGQYDHVRKYGLDYPERLRKAGFLVKEDNFVSTFSEEDQERYRFDLKEIIYFCTK